MREWFTFNGHSSKDFGVYISGNGTFNGAERDVESVSIPGRSGDLHIDKGKYNNVSLVYDAFIVRDFSKNVEAFRNLLLSQRGYQRLEDTYHDNEFRLAMFTGAFEVDAQDTLREGRFKITFDCQPQRFLKNGENPIILTASSSIMNANYTSSKPLVRVYGTGTVTIGNVPITITTADGYTDIDCDAESAFKDTIATDCNSNITLTDGQFWEIEPGVNAVTLGEGITRVEIIPRYWIL